jgi:hypothetical protein
MISQIHFVFYLCIEFINVHFSQIFTSYFVFICINFTLNCLQLHLKIVRNSYPDSLILIDNVYSIFIFKSTKICLRFTI